MSDRAQPSALDAAPSGAAGGKRRKTPGDLAKASFLRMVSHELRTPLNSIIGFSEILSCELFGPLGAPQYHEYAGIVRDSGYKLLKLVNQILEIVRLEDDAADLELEPVRLDHAVDDAADALTNELEARGVAIAVEGREAAPWALADPRALRTILVNLLQNAALFSPEGSQILVRAARRGGEVRIEVEDRGPGIELEDIPRLMRPFEQGENGLTRRSQGVGLGLTIVRLLCEAMDGALHLDSRPGQGLTAVVTLPAAEPVVRRPVAPERPAP
ncbi:MAG: HAMP domain-containing sensor histidine kinase [Caulobacteraceae bacterium]